MPWRSAVPPHHGDGGAHDTSGPGVALYGPWAHHTYRYASGPAPQARTARRHAGTQARRHAGRKARTARPRRGTCQRGGRLCAERRLDVKEALAPVADVQRELAPLGGVQAVRAQLVRRVLEREAAPEGRAQLAVLRQDEVLVAQRRSTRHAARLLAAAGEIERNPTLTLRVVEHLVELGHSHHGDLRGGGHGGGWGPGLNARPRGVWSGRCRQVVAGGAGDLHRHGRLLVDIWQLSTRADLAHVVNQPEARQGWRCVCAGWRLSALGPGLGLGLGRAASAHHQRAD